jgi:hypothetical protein
VCAIFIRPEVMYEVYYVRGACVVEWLRLTSEKKSAKVCRLNIPKAPTVGLVWFMMLNVTFNNISVIS